METLSVGRVIHPVVEKEENRRVDHPPYIRAENVREQAKFQAKASYQAFYASAAPPPSCSRVAASSYSIRRCKCATFCDRSRRSSSLRDSVMHTWKATSITNAKTVTRMAEV